MIGLLMVLIIVGVCLSLIDTIPIDPTIRMVIRVVVVLCVLLLLLQVFGLVDVAVPRLRLR